MILEVRYDSVRHPVCLGRQGGGGRGTCRVGRVAARVVPPLLLLIHRGPMEISKAGSGGVGGPTTTPHPRITSVHAPRACLGRQGGGGRGTCGVGRVAARVVPPLLLLIHRGPMEISKAGSGGVGGPTTTPHPRITSARSPGMPVMSGPLGRCASPIAH